LTKLDRIERLKHCRPKECYCVRWILCILF